MFHRTIVTLSCFGLAFGIAPQNARCQSFNGKLSRTLGVDPSFGSVLIWTAAPPSLAKALGIDSERLANLYQGTVGLGSKPGMQFGAAIAELKDGTVLFFIDHETGGGALRRAEPLSFGPAQETYYAREVIFKVPLKHAPFRDVPMFVALPKSTEGYPIKPGQFVVIAGDRPYVEGNVSLPGRKLMVRFSYDFDTASVPLDKAVEWFDVDGNGRIDTAPGSPERGVPNDTLPVFNLATMAVRTEAIDLRTHTFTLKQVPTDAKQISLSVGSHLPDSTYLDFSGQQHQLSEIKSKYILLDFWATWCGPCVADLPFKLEAYRRFHDKGFEILGMNGDADKGKAEAFLAKLKITWPEAKPDKDLLDHRFKITAWPTLVLIDDTGNIVSTNQPGHLPLSGTALQRTLEDLLH